MDLTAHLGPLKAGSARGLFANYRVTRQRPAAGTRIALGRRRRTAGGSGGFRLTPLSVWGAQAPAVAPCTPPPGSTVIASSAQAVITARQVEETGTPFVGWYGCLRAVGKRRLLTSALPYGYAGYYTSLGSAVLAGRFAAFSFSYEDKYFNCSSSVDIYDLQTGQPGQVFNAGCSYPGPYTPSGIDSLILSSSGFAAWRETDIPSAPLALSGVSCPSASLCVAVDGSGNLATASAPMSGRAAWSVANVDGHNPMTGVSCPSPSLCVAVDQAGNVLTSSNPTGGAGAWTVTHVDIIGSLSAVSCPSTSLCVATDTLGNVITSSHPTAGAGAWTAIVDATSAFVNLNGVSCPSISLCVAVGGGDVAASNDPTGGTTAWTVAHVAGSSDDITAVSCPSASLCMAGDGQGNLLTSTDPTGGASNWTLAKIEAGQPFDPVHGVSCPSTMLCVAVDQRGNAVTSTNPTGGASSWSVAHIDNIAALGDQASVNGVACQSSGLCVAVADEGDALTATDPSGGAGAWSSALIDAPASCQAAPCLVEQLYAHDDQGTRLIDSAAPGAGTSLTNIRLSGNLLTWSHDGAPQQATLH